MNFMSAPGGLYDPKAQFAPEEGSEGLLGPTEVRCRCLEDA